MQHKADMNKLYALKRRNEGEKERETKRLLLYLLFKNSSSLAKRLRTPQRRPREEKIEEKI